MTNPTATLLDRAPVCEREADTVKALRECALWLGGQCTELTQSKMWELAATARRAIAQYDTGAKRE